MVADELRRAVLAFPDQEFHDAPERVDQQLIAVDRLFLHHGFADVENMAGVHPINAVQLDVFRRNLEDRLHGLFGRQHFLHELEEGGILTGGLLAGIIHGEGAGRRWLGGPSG